MCFYVLRSWWYGPHMTLLKYILRVVKCLRALCCASSNTYSSRSSSSERHKYVESVQFAPQPLDSTLTPHQKCLTISRHLFSFIYAFFNILHQIDIRAKEKKKTNGKSRNCTTIRIEISKFSAVFQHVLTYLYKRELFFTHG